MHSRWLRTVICYSDSPAAAVVGPSRAQTKVPLCSTMDSRPLARRSSWEVVNSHSHSSRRQLDRTRITTAYTEQFPYTTGLMRAKLTPGALNIMWEISLAPYWLSTSRHTTCCWPVLLEFEGRLICSPAGGKNCVYIQKHTMGVQ